jgi:pyrimidine deaminase RibD-like protein
MRLNEFDQDDYIIKNRIKLDRILVELCHHIIKGQKQDPKKYGMVAAAVIDPDDKKVYGVNELSEDDKRKHAERVAIDRYKKHYGEIPTGSIIVTTLSPCNEYGNEMADQRYGESCTDLINESQCRKVYCGYIDPSQHNDHQEYTLEETTNEDIKGLCKKFADTFLKEK